MEQDNRQVIDPRDVLNFLADGKTREDIRNHYGLSKSDLKLLFQHDMLKGKKTKVAPGFVFATPSGTILNRETETNAVDNEQVNGENSTTNGTESEEQNLDSGVADRPSQWSN